MNAKKFKNPPTVRAYLARVQREHRARVKKRANGRADQTDPLANNPVQKPIQDLKEALPLE